MLRGEKEERERALQTSFFPTQPSSPDVYGLYKLLRARECPPLRSEQQRCRSPDLSLSLSLFALCLDSFTVNPSRHKQRRQLGNRTVARLQWLSIMATSQRFHTLLKNSPPPHDFSLFHTRFLSASPAPPLLPLSSDNYCSICVSIIQIFCYLSFSSVQPPPNSPYTTLC